MQFSNRTKMRKIIILLCAICLSMICTPAVAAQSLKLPKNFTTWTKSERKVVNDKNSLFYGIHYIYADTKAMQGYKGGNHFPEGSNIVVDYFNFKPNSPESEDGNRNMTVMMHKDKRAKETAGWFFAGFGADGRPTGLDPATTCLSCHQRTAAKQDHVISTIKDFIK